MGTFFTTNAGEPDFNGFKESVTRTLDKHDGLLSQAALAGALMDLTAKLGVEDAFTVFCSDGLRGEDTAVYCVLRACAAVTNPKVLCGAIRGGFGG